MAFRGCGGGRPPCMRWIPPAGAWAGCLSLHPPSSADCDSLRSGTRVARSQFREEAPSPRALRADPPLHGTRAARRSGWRWSTPRHAGLMCAPSRAASKLGLMRRDLGAGEAAWSVSSSAGSRDAWRSRRLRSRRASRRCDVRVRWRRCGGQTGWRGLARCQEEPGVGGVVRASRTMVLSSRRASRRDLGSLWRRPSVHHSW